MSDNNTVICLSDKDDEDWMPPPSSKMKRPTSGEEKEPDTPKRPRSRQKQKYDCYWSRQEEALNAIFSNKLLKTFKDISLGANQPEHDKTTSIALKHIHQQKNQSKSNPSNRSTILILTVRQLRTLPKIRSNRMQ